MKKSLVVTMMLGLVASALVVAPAEAKKKAKPVEHTLYLHGVNQFGEADGVQWFNDGAGPESVTTMSPEEPASGPPKSMNYFNPGLNDQCTGLPLAFPTFTTPVNGTIVGDATMKLHFLSAPATIQARIWTDIGAFVGCNEAYVEPASEVDIEIPPGQSEVEVTFPKLKLKGTYLLMVEILAYSGDAYEGQVGRLLYDSDTTASSITFDCVPGAGKSCV